MLNNLYYPKPNFDKIYQAYELSETFWCILQPA